MPYAKACQDRLYLCKSIDKTAKKSYYVAMVNKIKNQYYQYKPGDFLPIYIDGELANRSAFHAYRLKTIATPVVRRLLHTI